MRRERERTVRVRKRPRIAPLTAEEMDWLATLAADADRTDLAIRLVLMALRKRPDEAHLYHDLAFYRRRGGDVEGALRAYAEAARRSTDGRAEFEAAVLRARQQEGAADAAKLLARALEKEPWLVREVREPEWPPGFLDRADVRFSVARAEGATLPEP